REGEETDVEKPRRDEAPGESEVPVEPSREPAAEPRPGGKAIAFERVPEERRPAARPEPRIGAVDLEAARDHAEQQDRVRPVGQARDEAMAQHERTRRGAGLGRRIRRHVSRSGGFATAGPEPGSGSVVSRSGSPPATASGAGAGSVVSRSLIDPLLCHKGFPGDRGPPPGDLRAKKAPARCWNEENATGASHARSESSTAYSALLRHTWSCHGSLESFTGRR